VVLSAQATDSGVNKATPALFALADTPQKMLAVGEERIVELIRTIGLFRTKAKNLIALSRILVEQHGGAVPRDRAALEALPGGGAQPRQGRAERRLWRADDRGRHAHFPGGQSHRTRPGEDAAGGRDLARGGHAGRIQALCSSLADPARPLCVPSAQARLSRLR